MYNLYTYEKNNSLKAKEKSEEEKSKKIKLKRKLIISKLSTNYDKRMNNFILNLCSHPIFIKDYTSKNKNLKLNSPKKYKNFSFGGFMTDKNRINLLNKEKELSKKYEENIIEEKNKRIYKEKKFQVNKILIQPRMRFKPRNELERIIEVLDLLGKNKGDKKVKKILEQLKQTDIDRLKQVQGYGKLKQMYKNKAKANNENKNNSKNKSENNSMNEENKDSDLDYTLETNLYRKLRNINMQIKKQKKIRSERLKDNNNGEALENKFFLNNLRTRNKELLELFKDDEKMYFKGASQFSMNFKNNNITNKNQKIRVISAIPLFNSVNLIDDYKINKISKSKTPKMKLIKNNQRPLSMNNINVGIGNNSENQNSLSNFYIDDSVNKLGLKFQMKKRNMNNIINREINKSLLTQFFSNLNKKEYNEYFSEPIFLEKNSVLLHKEAKTLDSNLENKLEYLRKIINQNKNKKRTIIRQNSESLDENEVKKKNNYNDIIIDGKIFKQGDIRNIADAIFTKCGYYKTKIV